MTTINELEEIIQHFETAKKKSQDYAVMRLLPTTIGSIVSIFKELQTQLARLEDNNNILQSDLTTLRAEVQSLKTIKEPVARKVMPVNQVPTDIVGVSPLVAPKTVAEKSTKPGRGRPKKTQ